LKAHNGEAHQVSTVDTSNHPTADDTCEQPDAAQAIDLHTSQRCTADVPPRADEALAEADGVRAVELLANGQPSDLLARIDTGRVARKGVPEIVLADAKTDDQTLAIVRAFLESSGHAVVSRMRPQTMDLLAREFADPQIARLDLRRQARAAAIHAPGYTRPRNGGHIGVLTAGASDIPVAEEARLVAEEMGCRTSPLYDVGVAGLHRLLGPLQTLLADGPDAVAALIVCAGMDGALPSVVAGLAPVPVIGVPTSVGYGVGGKGRAALLAMLQTCSPGLTVVNIDNGVGAGATAALIANRLAAARRR